MKLNSSIKTERTQSMEAAEKYEKNKTKTKTKKELYMILLKDMRRHTEIIKLKV